MFPFWISTLNKYFYFRIQTNVFEKEIQFLPYWNFTVQDGSFLIKACLLFFNQKETSVILEDQTLFMDLCCSFIRGNIKDGKLNGLYLYANCSDTGDLGLNKLCWAYLKDNKINSPLYYVSKHGFQISYFDQEGQFQSFNKYSAPPNGDLLDFIWDPNFNLISLTKDQVLNESLEILSQLLDHLTLSLKPEDHNLNVEAEYSQDLPYYLDIRYNDEEPMTNRVNYPHRQEKYLNNEAPFIKNEQLANEPKCWFYNQPGDYELDPEIPQLQKDKDGFIFHPIFDNYSH